VKDREPAYTDPEIIDRICEAVIAKLTTDGLGTLLPKQDVGSSNLLTRSTVSFETMPPVINATLVRRTLILL
jgi:hypothetical protein